MKAASLTLLAMLVSSCASTPTVRTDADPSVEFSSYRTYNWLRRPDGVAPLQEQRIVDAVNAQLRAKGWVESADADIAIAAHVATKEKQTLDTFYSGPAYGGWGWNRGWGMGVGMGSATTTVHTYNVGTLVVDLFDTRTKQAVWRGTASGTLPSSQDKLDAGVQAGITGMFASFPPGTGSTN